MKKEYAIYSINRINRWDFNFTICCYMCVDGELPGEECDIFMTVTYMSCFINLGKKWSLILHNSALKELRYHTR